MAASFLFLLCRGVVEEHHGAKAPGNLPINLSPIWFNWGPWGPWAPWAPWAPWGPVEPNGAQIGVCAGYVWGMCADAF